jgi:hypothetical protein
VVIRIYAGFDQREEAGYHAFCSSVIHNASAPVSIAPVHGKQRDGTNAFTYARFMVPRMQHFADWALFVDGSDMVCLGDIAELWAMRDYRSSVQVVPHAYATKHPRKYVGTPMEADNRDYPRKNWSSVMLMNCAHPDWRYLDVANMTGDKLHRFEWTDRVTSLPMEWGWIVDEYGPNPDAKLLHWTAGIPAFEHYKNAPMADQWWKAFNNVTHTIK